MKIAEHLAKARRYEASLSKLTPPADVELVIWAAMNCGTNLVNAALHQLGVTDERDGFATHHEHVYVAPVPGSALPRYERVHYERGDLIHADKPMLAAEAPTAIVPAMQALKAIEDMRPAYVRGSEPYSPEVSARCAEHLATIKETCRRILGNAV